MPYWIVHGLFHASLTKSTSNLSGTCWFIITTCSWDLPNSVSNPCVTSLGQNNPWMLSGHLGASMKLAVRGGILKICMVPKRLEIQPNYSSWEKKRQNRVENGVQYSGKGKTTSAVVSKCALRFWNPEKKSTTGSACNTKKLTIHIIHQDIHLQHLDFHGEILHNYFPQWFWCSV